MTTKTGGERFRTWRDLSRGGTRANQARNANAFAQGFAQAVQNVNSQRRAVGSSVVLPPGLGPSSPFAAATQAVGVSPQVQRVLAEQQARAQEEASGGGGWIDNLVSDATSTVRGFVPGMAQLAGGTVADIGQYLGDNVQDLTEIPGNIREGDFGAAAGNFVRPATAAVPVAGLANLISRHQENPDDYQTTASVAQSFRRTANDIGAVGSVITGLGEGREAAGDRLYDRFYNRPFSSALEDVGNVAVLAAPLGTAVRPPGSAFARGAVSRGLENAIARGSEGGTFARAAASTGRAVGRGVNAVNDAMSYPIVKPIQLASEGLNRIPSVQRFRMGNAMNRAQSRALNEAANVAPIQQMPAYINAWQALNSIAERRGIPIEIVDGAQSILRHPGFRGLGPDGVMATLQRDPTAFSRELPAALLLDQADVYNVPMESVQLAAEAMRNPTLMAEFDAPLQSIENWQRVRDEARTRGRAAGFNRELPESELGPVMYDQGQIERTPAVQEAAARRTALQGTRTSLEQRLAARQADYEASLRGVRPGNEIELSGAAGPRQNFTPPPAPDAPVIPPLQEGDMLRFRRPRGNETTGRITEVLDDGNFMTRTVGNRQRIRGVTADEVLGSIRSDRFRDPQGMPLRPGTDVIQEPGAPRISMAEAAVDMRNAPGVRQLRQELTDLGFQLERVNDELLANRRTMLAEIKKAAQTAAKVPERFKPAVDTVNRLRNEAFATLDEMIAAGAPESSIILVLDAIKELPQTIGEIMNRLQEQGFRLDERPQNIDLGGFRAAAPDALPERNTVSMYPNEGRAVREQIGGTFDPDRPMSTIIQQDAVAARRTVRGEKKIGKNIKPRRLAAEALFELDNWARATFNVVLERTLKGVTKTSRELFGDTAPVFATDETGRMAAVAAKQGHARAQTITIDGHTWNIPEGERWIAWDRDALFNGSVMNAADINNAVFIPESMAEAVRGQIDSMLNNTRSVALRLYDQTNNIYRNMWLALSPRWNVGNIVGNLFALRFAGGVPLADLANMFPEIKRISDDFYRNNILPDESMHRLFGQGMTNATSDIFRGLPGGRGNGGVIQRLYRWNSTIDSMSRTAMFLSQIGDQNLATIRAGGEWRSKPIVNRATGEASTLGTLVDNAMNETMRVVGDFTTMLPVERRLFRRIAPFYAWYRHVTKLMATQPVYHPLRTAWTLHLSDLMFDADDREFLPEWMQSTAMENNGQLWSVGGLVPYGDQFNEGGLFNNPVDFLTRAQAPALSLSAAALAGDQRWGGDPIRDQIGMETGPLIDEPQRMAGFAAQLAGGPFRAAQGVIQPQSRTTYGTERTFEGEPQLPFRTPIGAALQYLIGAAPYNMAIDYEAIREQELESAEREAEERERRRRGR